MKQRNHWFKAKDGGLGWSLPLTWQGWLVYIVMFGGIAYAFVTGRDVGHRVLGVWAAILAALPFFWIFGQPLSAKKSGK